MTGRGRQAWIAVFVLLMTFGSGALVGVTLERTVFDRGEPPRPFVQPRPDGPGPVPGSSAGRIFATESPLAQQLDLTEDQRTRIDSILQADRSKANQVLRRMRPQLQARYDSTTAAIMEVLTPEQREEFDRLSQVRRNRLQERVGGPRGRPGRE